ncbi:BTB/POZ domain-containing protein At3g22104 [Linum perenne]
MEARRRHLLHVDVAGEEVFIVDKQILESFSGRLNRLFLKTKSTQITKLIFDDFPGGADGFELITRFCYGGGKFRISPSNFVLFHSAARFMEIDTNQSEKSAHIGSWSWSELVSVLRQSQGLVFSSRFDSFLLNEVVERISLTVVASSSPLTSFSEHSGDDVSNTTASVANCSREWWFEDLVFLSPDLMDKSVRLMAMKKVDHSVIFKFVVSYLKFNIRGHTSSDFRTNVIDTVVNLFLVLDRSVLSCKTLFEVLRVVSRLEMKKKRRSEMKVKLETLIGLVLDGAKLDQLMIVPSGRRSYKYDVGLVMRLVKAFLIEGWANPVRLKRVISLIDSYIHEVAPDSQLNPSEFTKLVTILPDWGRECGDVLYHAIDIYLETHANELHGSKEKARICMALNQRKLSTEASRHLASNPNFQSSSTTTITMLVSQQQSKLFCNTMKSCPKMCS